MSHGIVRVPDPVNEPVREYGPGSHEKKSLKLRLAEMLATEIEIPLIIGGREVRTGTTSQAVCPHDHGHVLATVHQAGAAEVELAVEASQEAWKEWSEMPWESRSAVFLKAAELLAGPWRDTLNAATMLNQSKTVFQAEIDAACELIDFWRFNPYYMNRLLGEQPGSAPGIWDRVEYRALEGFVFAVTPFNFTSIGGNLPTAPAMMGNVVLWKPASSAPLAAYYTMKLLEEAGLPPGVINFLRTSPVTGPIRASSGRPAARTSSSRTLPPAAIRWPRRSCAAPSRIRVRSARQHPAPMSRLRSGRRCGPDSWNRWSRSARDRRSTSATSWAR